MIIDILCVLLFGWGFWVGYQRNILQSVFLIVILIASLLGAMWFTPLLNNLAGQYSGLNDKYTAPLSFLLSFGAVFLICKMILNALEEQFLQRSKMQLAHNFGGGALIGVLFLFLGSSLIRFSVESALIPPTVAEASFSYKYVKMLPEQGYKAVRSTVPLTREFYRYMFERNKPVNETDSSNPKQQDAEDNKTIIIEERETPPPSGDKPTPLKRK